MIEIHEFKLWERECQGLSKINKQLWTRAVFSQNLEGVLELLEYEEINLNALNAQGVGLLYELINYTPYANYNRKFNLPIIKELVNNKNLDINLRNTTSDMGETALFSAIRNNDIEIVETLLARKDLNLNIFCKRSLKNGENKFERPIIESFKNQNLEIIKLLLQDERFDFGLPVVITKTDNLDCMDCIHYFFKNKPSALMDLQNYAVLRNDFKNSTKFTAKLLPQISIVQKEIFKEKL